MNTASIKDVALRAKVSVGTVSNVLNHPDMVKPDTRERVLRSIEELGFVRNEAARQLRAGQSRIIAFLIFDPSNPFFTDVSKGAEQAAREAGCVLYLASSGEDLEREHEHLDVLMEQRIRGALITPLDKDWRHLRQLKDRGVPVVLVDRPAVDAESWCSVSVDDVEGGDLAVEHLLDLGHERIAFVGGPLSLTQFADRLTGARRAMERAGLPEKNLTIIETAAPVVAGGRVGAQRLVGMPARRRPTAAFCGNDLLALGFLQQVMTHGWVVPDDISIVGYDDIEFAGAAAVPLTSVAQPRHELGYTAAKLLLAEPAGGRQTPGEPEHHHQQVQFTPELVVRSSTSAPKVRVRAEPA